MMLYALIFNLWHHHFVNWYRQQL